MGEPLTNPHPSIAEVNNEASFLTPTQVKWYLD